MNSVLLYSGGIDSYVVAALHQPDVLLNVDVGTLYGQVERARLETPPGLEDRVAYAELRELVRFERPGNFVLPARNAYLVLVAAEYGDDIMLAATANDAIFDKDEIFAERMTALLEHLYKPQWWLPEGRPVRLVLPVKEFTKRELVAQYLDAGHSGKELADRTFSCYTPNDDADQCGECKPCRRKWCVLVLNDIDPGYDARPSLEPLVAQIKDGTSTLRAHEARDVMEAWVKTT